MPEVFDEFAAHANSEIEKHDVEDFDAFIEIAGNSLRHAIKEKLYISALNQLLGNLAKKEQVVNISTTNGSFIFFSANSHSNWSFIFHGKPQKFLYLSPLSVVQSYICGAGLSVERFHCEPQPSMDELNSGVRLTAEGAQAAKPGQIYSRKARSQILDWHSLDDRGVDNPPGPGVTIRINSVIPSSFEWYFDRTALRPLGMIPINVLESNVTTLLSLLAVAGDDHTVDYVKPLVESPVHYIRWAAVQTISALNSAQGLSCLTKLAEDAHPEVRTAARAHLDAHSQERSQ